MQEDYVGKTLGFAAWRSGFRHKGYRVYVLHGENDSSGELAASDYELKRIVRMIPHLRHCRVISQEDYYGIRIFRVRRPDSNE